MRSTWLIFCMFVILSCAALTMLAQVASDADEKIIADIKNDLTVIVNSASEDKLELEEGSGIYKMQAYKDLRSLCMKNWALVLERWNDLIDGKNKELRGIALFRPFEFDPLNPDDNAEYMKPADYIAFIRKAVPLFKEMNDLEMLRKVLSNSGLLFTYNYRLPEVRALLSDTIPIAQEIGIKEGEVEVRRVLNGDSFFYEVSQSEEASLENENIWEAIVSKYAIGNEFNGTHLYLLSVYSAGATVYKSPFRGSLGIAVERSGVNQIMSLAQIRESVHDILINHPMSEVDEKAYQNMARRWLPCSYSAELELLKILNDRKLPLDRRMMITDVLWKGVYATDQVQRFLPLLRDRERGIRESAFESMPAWLKEGMQYDASKQPSSEEFAALSAVAAENMKKHQDRLCQIQ